MNHHFSLEFLGFLPSFSLGSGGGGQCWRRPAPLWCRYLPDGEKGRKKGWRKGWEKVGYIYNKYTYIFIIYVYYILLYIFLQTGEITRKEKLEHFLEESGKERVTNQDFELIVLKSTLLYTPSFPSDVWRSTPLNCYAYLSNSGTFFLSDLGERRPPQPAQPLQFLSRKFVKVYLWISLDIQV